MKAQSINFYSLAQTERYQPQNKLVVAIMIFKPTGVDGKIPEITLNVGNETIIGFFYTGNPGNLQLTASLKDKLAREGYLIIDDGKYANGVYEPYIRATLNGLYSQGTPLADVHNLNFTIGKENSFGMRYPFLKNYTIAWNYQNQTITLQVP